MRQEGDEAGLGQVLWGPVDRTRLDRFEDGGERQNRWSKALFHRGGALLPSKPMSRREPGRAIAGSGPLGSCSLNLGQDGLADIIAVSGATART